MCFVLFFFYLEYYNSQLSFCSQTWMMHLVLFGVSHRVIQFSLFDKLIWHNKKQPTMQGWHWVPVKVWIGCSNAAPAHSGGTLPLCGQCWEAWRVSCCPFFVLFHPKHPELTRDFLFWLKGTKERLWNSLGGIHLSRVIWKTYCTLRWNVLWEVGSPSGSKVRPSGTQQQDSQQCLLSWTSPASAPEWEAPPACYSKALCLFNKAAKAHVKETIFMRCL